MLNLTLIQIFSSHSTVNTHSLGYKNQVMLCTEMIPLCSKVLSEYVNTQRG